MLIKGNYTSGKNINLKGKLLPFGKTIINKKTCNIYMPSYAARHFETFVKERNEKSIVINLASRVKEINTASKTLPILTINLTGLIFVGQNFKIRNEEITLDKLAKALTKEQAGINNFTEEICKAIFDKLTTTQIGEIEKIIWPNLLQRLKIQR